MKSLKMQYRAMNHWLVVVLFFLVLIFVGCTAKQNDYPISAVDIRGVSLTDHFWLPKIKTIQQVTIPHAFRKCEEEGRMENFLIAAAAMEGIPGKVKGLMPFDDTDPYKIIEGASYSLISSPDSALDVYLDSIISIIAKGQEPDGYLTTWITIDPSNPPASWVEPPHERWKSEITSHELYNIGHLYEAAVAHYQSTGKRNFLDIALKNADFLLKTFGPGKRSIVPGHQIIETGLVKLYRITGNKKYLDLAKFFLDERGNPKTHTLYGAYYQDHLPVTSQEEVVGHAVRGLYMYAGMTDIAALYSDTAYLHAVNGLWDNMVNKKMYLTGGLGARHDGESFGDNYELPNLTAYAETCASIGSVYWNQRLFRLTGDARYYDVIERTLYNGLISGISLDGTLFFYPNPLESDGNFPFNKGVCTRQSWFDCSCCPTNLIRFLPSIPGLIYATQQDSIYINLFIGSHATIPMGRDHVDLIQETDYPWNGKISIRVNPSTRQRFTLKIRIPGWVENRVTPGDLYAYTEEIKGKLMLKVNGELRDIQSADGFATLTREWDKGDQIELQLPMEVRRVTAHEKITENQGKVALEYGPLVYCAEGADNAEGFTEGGISPMTEFTLSSREDFLQGAVTLREKNPAPGHAARVFIPYYAWSNRGVNSMKLWFTKL